MNRGGVREWIQGVSPNVTHLMVLIIIGGVLRPYIQ